MSPERENVPQELIAVFFVFISNEAHPILAFAKLGRAASVQPYLSNVEYEYAARLQSRERAPKHIDQRVLTLVSIKLIAEHIA